MSDFHQTMLAAGVWMIVAALFRRGDRDADTIAGGSAAICALIILLAQVFR